MGVYVSTYKLTPIHDIDIIILGGVFVTELVRADGVTEVTEVSPSAIESNRIIDATSKFTSEMMNVFYLCLSATRPQLSNSKYYDESGKTKVIPKSVLKVELERSKLHGANLKNACTALAGTPIVSNFANGWGVRPLFYMIEYRDDEGLMFRWHPDLEPYILTLEQNYTEVICRYIYLTGRDKWAKRIIEQISRWKYKYPKGREYSYQELRDLFGIEKKEYADGDGKKNFGKRLKKACKTITDKTPLTVTAEPLKKNPRETREVSHYFLAWTTEPQLPIVQQEQKPPAPTLKELEDAGQQRLFEEQTPISELSAPEQDVADRMHSKYSIPVAQASEYVRTLGIDYCQKQMEYVRKAKNAGNARNAGGYLVKALEGDYAGSRLAQENAKAQENANRAEKAAWDKTAKAQMAGDYEPQKMSDEQAQRGRAKMAELMARLGQK
jgi:hypothetical protein